MLRALELVGKTVSFGRDAAKALKGQGGARICNLPSDHSEDNSRANPPPHTQRAKEMKPCGQVNNWWIWGKDKSPSRNSLSPSLGLNLLQIGQIVLFFKKAPSKIT